MLVRLRNLDFGVNSLTGTIPNLANLTQLRQIGLANNSLTGTVPLYLPKLIQLETLYLEFNSLTGPIPSIIASLTLLENLNLGDNSLTGTIPSVLGSMNFMADLLLNNNFLTGTIPNLEHLTGLEQLILSNNFLSGTIPSYIGRLTNLSQIMLGNNPLSGTIPNIENVTGLDGLFLNNNSLQGTIPSYLGKFTSLHSIYLAQNSLTGTIPPALGGMSSLEFLLLNDNSLTGTIPTLANLGNLLKLVCSNNSLTGSIPSLKGMPNLQVCDLSSNHLQGSIPSALGYSSALQYFYCDQNNLSGTIPEQLGTLKNLQLLYLQRNRLEGSVPKGVLTSSRLKYFDVSFNSLVSVNLSSIPLSSQLSYLNLAYTQLTGSLPTTLFALSQLSTLIIASTCLTGTIPSLICNLTQLTNLVLDGVGVGSNCNTKKKFSGAIPDCVFLLPSLDVLHLAGNGLTGHLSEIAPKSNLSVLNLGNNHLSGTLPSSIQSHQFSILDVSFNMIGGTLIDIFQAPTSILSMNVNHLSGHPPSTLTSVPVSTSLNILQGNLLGCPLLTDDVNNSVGCGSSSLSSIFAVWLSICTTITLCVVVIHRHRYVPYVSRLMHWHKTFLSDSLSVSHTTKTIDTLERACFVSVGLVVFFIVVVMVSYIAVKRSGEDSYQVQYLYTTTAAYTSGVTVVVLVWIYVTISALFLLVTCTQSDKVFSSIISTSAVSAVRIGTDDEGKGLNNKIQRIITDTVIEFLVLSVAVAVNLGYVYIIYFIKPNRLAYIQFAFATMSSVLIFVVLQVSKRLPKSSRQVHVLLMSVGVNILSPGIATLLLSPLCLYYKFNPLPISFTYEYPYEVISMIEINGVANYFFSTIQRSATVTFTPLWDYSYQCSSSLTTSYLPKFVFLYTLNGIVYPLIKLGLITISRNMKNIKKMLQRFGVINYGIFYAVEDEIGDDTITSSSLTTTALYALETLDTMPTLCFDLSMLLTFGLSSPLLAVVISWSMVFNTLILRLAIGRYMCLTNNIMGQSSCYYLLERAFGDEWKCLRRSWWIMTILIGLFWSLFIYDMIGIKYPSIAIYISLAMLFWCPLIFISMQKYLSLEAINNSSSIITQLKRMILVWHDILWVSILRTGNVRSSKNSTTTTIGDEVNSILRQNVELTTK